MSEPKQRGLTGIVPVKNGIERDYCPELAVRSMLPICNEVIVSDGQSDDGTREFFVEWATREPRLRVVDYPWPNPVGDRWFLSKWLNWTQQFARYDNVCALDADEVFDPSSYDKMARAAGRGVSLWFYRVNLWRDPQHEAPHGTVCGHLVVRQNPTHLKLVSDNIYPADEEPEVRRVATHDPSLVIWHLGFLRDKRKFLKKARAELSYLLNTWDQRLQRAEDTGEDWVEFSTWKDKPLIEHKRPLPDLVKPWLRERGHHIA